jgi:xylan 1,4-beta-xylosidase
MYRISAQVIKAIDPALRVGGPATSNFVPDGRFEAETEDVSRQVTLTMKDLGEGDWQGVWIREFLAFCSANKLPVDFVSCHPYPTDFPIDNGGLFHPRTRPVTSTTDDLQWVRKVIDAGPYPDAEIHLTEWSSSPSPRDHSHDSLPAATFVVRANLESIGLVDSLSYWVFTDVFEESAAGDTIFHGGFGLINFQGIVKPTFHAYRFLHELGHEMLARVPGLIATRNHEGLVQVLGYHYPPELREAPPMAKSPSDAEKILALGEPRPVDIQTRDLRPGARFVVETLDSLHGFALKAWKDLGSPEPPTREQAEALRAESWKLQREEITADGSGCLNFRRTVAPWTVFLIREVAEST